AASTECMCKMARSSVCPRSYATSGAAAAAVQQKRDKVACGCKYGWTWHREGCKGRGCKRDEQPNAVERHTRHHYRRAVCITWMRVISRSPRCERTARRAATG